MSADPNGAFGSLDSLLARYERGERRSISDAAFAEVGWLCRHFYPSQHVSGEGWLGGPKTEDVVQSPEHKSAALIPLWSNAGGSLTRVLERSTIYSQLTLLVVPARVGQLSMSYSGIGEESRLDENLDRILAYNCRYRELVKRGHCLFLPASWRREFESVSDYEVEEANAPWRQAPDNLRFVPTNVSALQVQEPSMEMLQVYAQIVLPYFPGAGLDTLSKIAQEETDAFSRFNLFLSKSLSRLPRAASTDEVRDVLAEIEFGVADLRAEADKLKKSQLLRGVELGFFTVSLALAVVAPGVPQTVAGMIGSASFFDLIRGSISRKQDAAALKRSEFWVPYVLDSGQDTRLRRGARRILRPTRRVFR